MNAIFCKIPWMKNYEGVIDEDESINGESYNKDDQYGNESCNFIDNNGKCFGFIMLDGDIPLELYFKDATKETLLIKDVLVVWVATNDSNETRIVGWYKNATIYRKEQCKQAFTSEDCFLCYRIEALSINCYLLQEVDRTFSIQGEVQICKDNAIGRSNLWSVDTEFVQLVFKYIENNNDRPANLIVSDDIINEVIGDDNSDYNMLYSKGQKYSEDNNYLESLRYFNTARLISDTPGVLYGIAESLFSLSCFDKAIEIFKKIIKIEGRNAETSRYLAFCYDYIFDRQKTIKYCKELFDLLEDSKENIDEKIEIYHIIFSLYIYLKDEKNSRETMDNLSSYSDDEYAKDYVKEMQNILEKEFSKLG